MMQSTSKNSVLIRGLKYIRLKKGISIRELARMIKRDEKIIRKYESNGNVSIETMELLCNVLSVTHQEIERPVLINRLELEKLQETIESRIGTNKYQHIKNFKAGLILNKW